MRIKLCKGNISCVNRIECMLSQPILSQLSKILIVVTIIMFMMMIMNVIINLSISVSVSTSIGASATVG